MTKDERVSNEALLSAGLELMRLNGKQLERMQSKGRAMLFRLPNGESVRARTCNDHILLVVADNPDPDAKLNIEGTDWLLIAMPETERTRGKVIAYLVPAKEAARAARETHITWLASDPNTKGANTTFNLWFDKDGPEPANNFGEIWSKYRIHGDVTTDAVLAREGEPPGDGVGIQAEVAAARQRIAQIAGVTPEAVKISIDFGM